MNREQELNNFLKEKKWKRALSVALLLDRPFRCYDIINKILQDDHHEGGQGKQNLTKTLVKMREDQISKN
jgi:hypothetical protein